MEGRPKFNVIYAPWSHFLTNFFADIWYKLSKKSSPLKY